MSLPHRPRDLVAPVPNSPFYSPGVTSFQGPYYPSIISSSSGLFVDGDGVIHVTGGGGEGTLTGVTATAPLTVDNNIPAVPNLAINVATLSSVGVVSVGTNISVDETGAISVSDASTSNKGVVQLYNGTNSQSETLALTAAQGKHLQDEIDALSITSNITLAGTLNAATGLLNSVTSAGTLAGFEVGSLLPTAVEGNEDYFVIADVPAASYTPPGGSATEVHVGDWFLSSGSSWQFLNVGFQAPYASEAIPGVVELATAAATQNGIDPLRAVTPFTLQSKVSDQVDLTSSTTIASSTAVKAAYDLANGAIPKSTFTAAGQVIVGTGLGTSAALPVGTPNQVLTVNGAGTGLVWTTPTVGTVTSISTGAGLTGGPITSSGTIALADTAVSAGTYTYGTFTVDQKGRITAASNGTVPVLPSDFTAKGSLLTGISTGNYTALSVGGDGTILVADSCCTTGVKWTTRDAKPNCSGFVLGQTNTCNFNVSLDAACNALSGNTTGSLNVALGLNALWGNTTGSQNIALGNGAGSGNVEGNCNIFLGTTSGLANISGNSNIFLGAGSGSKNTTGSNNIALGQFSLLNSVSGNHNISLGFLSGDNITSGSHNVVIGYNACVPDAAGDNQLAIGFDAVNWITGYNTGAIKPGAGIVDSCGSCGSAGQVLSSTGNNALLWVAPGGGGGSACPATPTIAGTVFGQTNINNANVSLDGNCLALTSNTTGCRNVAFGAAALRCNTSGNASVGIGYTALFNNTTGFCNVAIGSSALFGNCTGIYNTAVGAGASGVATGCQNTAFGAFSLCQLVTGDFNTAIGNCAGLNLTSGSNNVVIGSGVSLPSATCDRQLAIGFTDTAGCSQTWLTGNSAKAIKPGAGIIDTGNGTGTSGQVLTSTGANAIQWATPDSGYKILTTTRTLTANLSYGIFSVDFNTPFFAWVYVSAWNPSTGDLGLKQYMIGATPAKNLVDTATVHEVPATSGWTLGDNVTTNIMVYYFEPPVTGSWNLEFKWMPMQTSFINNPPTPQLV